MPPEASGDQLRGEDSDDKPILPEIAVTKTPKPTADLMKFTKVYTIDLKKFDISNDGTRPAETSKGLNAALQDAKKAEANRIVFPKGIYLISEKDPVILDHKDTVIDLNGATLQINPNGKSNYSVVAFVDGAENVRLTNGTIKGDRDAHDYKAESGTHEGGAGVRLISGRNLEIDHLLACDMTGDGLVGESQGTRTRPELLARIKHEIYAKNLESGGFTEKGVPTASTEKTRSIRPLDLSKYEGQFELGYMGGYMGYPFIKGRGYQVYFYDADMNFLEKRKCLQYRKVVLPPKARWMNLEFNQPVVTDRSEQKGVAQGDWIARITNFRSPTDVHLHHNVFSKNRRLGLAYCGGQKWLIEENRFEENGGTAPAFGVDFEDGWEMMQDIVFRNNTFSGNQVGDLVVCAGSELLFEKNRFEKAVVVWGRPHNYVFRNNRFLGGKVTYRTRTGVARIHDNQYENCKLEILFDTKAVADGLVRKPGQTVSTPPLMLENETLTRVTQIAGTYFDFTNATLQGCKFVAGKETRLIRFLGGRVSDSSIFYEAEGPEVHVRIEGVDGKFVEEGPGLPRRRPPLEENP
ncbi:MAG: right-handed parallel beta-helix repeat-containing protein [Verrucomicrobiae bacterium]|nr:right-handed parallel beta-helix repeat-containing protein [Verrucomicrobiae bacterium]